MENQKILKFLEHFFFFFLGENKIPKGFEIHHWNYLDCFLEDFFVLPIKEHRKSHTFLNKVNNIFEGLNGEILDTREKHFNYLVIKGIVF